MMPNKTNKQYSTIKQANAMILGRQSMNLMAKRLLIFAGKKIDRTSPKPNEVQILFEEFAEFIKTRKVKNWKGRKKILSKIFKNLNDHPLVLFNKEQRKGKRIYKCLNWLQSLRIDEDTRAIVLVFTDEIGQYFSYIENQPYTNTLDSIGQYSSMSTIRLQEIIELEKFKNKPYFDIEVETLKWCLGVDKYYAKFSSFNYKVLKVAQKELADKNAPVQFTFDTLGRNKQVVKQGVHSIRIYPQFIDTAIGEEQPDIEQVPTVSAAPVAPIQEDPPLPHKAQYASIFEKLTSWGILAIIVNEHIEQKGIEKVKMAIAIASKPGVKDRAGMYMSAIKNDWKSEEYRKKQAAKAAKNKQVAIAKEQQATEQLKKAITQEVRTRTKKITDQLIAQNKDLLEKAAQQFQQKKQASGGSIVLKNLPTDAREAYASRLYKWHLIEEIKGIHPDSFTFSFADWPKEHPIEYQDLLKRVTKHYKENSEASSKEQEILIQLTMTRCFNKKYTRKK